jgi:Tfp pilus assembly protein PilO
VPALPLDEAGQYVAAAYIVFVVLLIVYVAIMATRLGHLSREIESLAELAERRDRERRESAARDEPVGGAAVGAESGTSREAEAGGSTS